MKAFILAAGKGERLSPITNTWPKPAIPMLNIPLVYYVATPLIRLGVSEIIFNTHHLPKIMAATMQALEPLLPVRVSHETDALLGSGGGIWFAKEWLKREHSFIVANGDEILLPESDTWLKDAIETHLANDALATLVTIDQDGLGTKFGAVWCDDKSMVQGFGKTAPREGLTPRHFTGFQIISRRIFNYLPVGESNIFYDVLVKAIPKGEKVVSCHITGRWFETGNQNDFLLATKSLLEIFHQKSSQAFTDLTNIFWSDVDRSTCKLASDFSPSHDTLLGNGVHIDSGCTFLGFNIIGHNVKIESGAKLENTVVLPGAIVKSGTSFSNQVVV
jgi:NDP-sugar pyrophosphorylase family protein